MIYISKIEKQLYDGSFVCMNNLNTGVLDNGYKYVITLKNDKTGETFETSVSDVLEKYKSIYGIVKEIHFNSWNMPTLSKDYDSPVLVAIDDISIKFLRFVKHIQLCENFNVRHVNDKYNTIEVVKSIERHDIVDYGNREKPLISYYIPGICPLDELNSLFTYKVSFANPYFVTIWNVFKDCIDLLPTFLNQQKFITTICSTKSKFMLLGFNITNEIRTFYTKYKLLES